MQASTRFVALGLATLAGCGRAAPDAAHRPQAVRVQEVRPGPVIEGHTHLAEVVPARTVQVVAQVPGTVDSLGPPEGQDTTLGTPVVHLSAPDVHARGTRASAEHRRARGERDFACAQLETDRALAAAGDLPAVQLDRSEKACAAAADGVAAAGAAEREARVAGGRTTERAPFDGRVLSYLVDPGQAVMPGTPLARYGSETLQLRLRVVAGDLDGVAAGTSARTEAGPGRVVSVGAQAQGPARLYEVLVALDDASGLRVGATLDATLVVDEWVEASAVPEGAIGQDPDGTYVLVQAGDHLERIDVQTGPRSEGWIAVSPPLPGGTRVATGSVDELATHRPVLAVLP